HGSLVLSALHSFPTRRSSDLTSVLAINPCSWRRFRSVVGLTDNPCPPCSTASFCVSATAASGSRYRSSPSTQPIRLPWDCHSDRSEEHTSELQSRGHLVCRLL